MYVFPAVPDNYRIESELRDPLPRRVRYKRSITVGRLILLNVLIAGVCLYCCFGMKAPFAGGVLSFVIFVVQLESTWHSNFNLLRHGVAVVGIVTRRHPIKSGDGVSRYQLTYRYPRRDGTRGQNEVTVDRQRYEHYVEGTQLTILRNPVDDYSSAPYFLILGVEVEGAPHRNAIGGVDPETVAALQ